jgi:hypothetical protein
MSIIQPEETEEDQIKPKKPFLKSGGGKNAMMMKNATLRPATAKPEKI